MSALLLIGGLFLLAIAGDALVKGAVSAARRLRIPPIIIGLTIVAFGTSAPELVVSLDAALKGAPDLAIGNVVGSNIANILLVLGLPAIIMPILITETGVRRSVVFMVATGMLFAALGFDGTLTRGDGLILLAMLAIYLGYSAYAASGARNADAPLAAPEELDTPLLSIPQLVLMLVFGIVGLAVGGKMTTEGALGIARTFDLADSAVGLTIVALGTSLPELATSVAAALRRHTGVVIGNVVGSNIMNGLAILGITSTFLPLPVSSTILSFDIWVMIAVSLALVPIAFWSRGLNRFEGGVMTAAYIVYTIFVFTQGGAG